MKTFFNQHWPIIGIILVALLLRLPLLNGSFWLDEAAQALESARPLTQQLNIVNDFQPPLIHVLLHFLLYVSRTEWWLRLGSALVPGLVSIWGTYEIGKRFFSKQSGLLAALLLATSSFHIFYSQEARPYALPMMFAVLSWLVLLQLIQQKKESWSLRIYFFLSSLLGLYASYIYPFLFLSQMLFVFLFEKKFIKEMFLLVCGVSIFFLPWLPFFFQQLRAGQDLTVQLPGWSSVVGFSQYKSLVLIADKFVFGVIHVEKSIFFISIFGGLFLAISVFFMRLFSLPRKNLHRYIPLVFWLLLPSLLAWIVSFWIPVLQPKRVLFSLPALELLISAAAFDVFQQSKIKKFTFAVFLLPAVFLFINVYSTFSYYITPKYQREDWRGLHQIILAKYPKNSVVVFAFPEAFAPWRWYDDGKYPTMTTDTLSVQENTDLSSLRKVTDYDYVLVFDYLRDLTDPHNRVTSEIEKYGYQEATEINPTTPIGFVRVFAKKSARLSENNADRN